MPLLHNQIRRSTQCDCHKGYGSDKKTRDILGILSKIQIPKAKLQLGLESWISPHLFAVLIRKKDYGAKARPMNPNRLLPHPRPRRAYSAGPAKGRVAANIHLTTVFAPIALAA